VTLPEETGSNREHKLFPKASQAYFYSTLNKDLHYVQVNTLAAGLLGMKADELIGTSIVDLFPGFEKTEFFKTYTHVLETGRMEVVSASFTLPG